MDPERYYVEFADACHRAIDRDCSKYFKRYDPELPRVSKIIGMLQSLRPDSVLDVGSGRGRLFWPMVNAFPQTYFAAMDVTPWRCQVFRAVKNGGLEGRVGVLEEDISNVMLVRDFYQVVVASEVLEHIPNVQQALNNIVHTAERAVIITVPSKPDNNPDHIHFLPQKVWSGMFELASSATGKEIAKLQFDYTPKELVIYAGIK
ncbi:MAG: class I SAM-dependent methyltransferase [bacterium]